MGYRVKLQVPMYLHNILYNSIVMQSAVKCQKKKNTKIITKKELQKKLHVHSPLGGARV